MLYLYDHYGLAIISGMHRDAQNQGLASVQKQLDTIAPGTKVADVLHHFQVMNLIDRLVDVKGGQVKGIDKNLVTSKSLNSTLNLANPTTNIKPGAAPNGADYVVLRSVGAALPTALSFTGAQATSPSDDAASSDDPTAALDQAFGESGGSAPVDNWHVSLVGIDAKGHKAFVGSFDGFSQAVSAANLKAFAAYPLLVAVVSHDDTNDIDGAGENYAAYTLTINGREQAG
jgi:hypothetical protein